MKEGILDTIMRGLLVLGLMLFGLRGVLPDAISSEQFIPALVAASAVIIGYAVGRVAYKCPQVCGPEVCRI